MANIVITLSQFCNFITKTGMHRYNAVKSIHRDLHSEYTDNITQMIPPVSLK